MNWLKILIILFGSLGSWAYAENPYLTDLSRFWNKAEIIVVPAGNTLKEMPKLPPTTVLRIKLLDQTSLSNNGDSQSTQEIVTYARKKIPAVVKTLRERGLLAEINRVSRIYGVDPLHLLGPIVTEKVFNGFIDSSLQDSLSSFLIEDLNRIGQSLQARASHKDIQDCFTSSISNYWKWQCLLYYSRDEQGNPFILKLKKGASYGIAQFNPLLIWTLNDVVQEIGGLNPVPFGHFDRALEIVLNPKEILHYLAAYSLTIQDLYKSVAGFDLSKNPGLVGSLYNLGDEYKRAYYARNRRSYPLDGEINPQVNYFGWFINHFERELRQELQK